MDAHRREIGVVEAGAAHVLALELEPERSHQMQRAARIGAQADDVARVGRNFRSEQDDVEHGGSRIRRRGPTAVQAWHNARHGHLRQPRHADPLRCEFCGLELRLPDRPALRLRRIRGGVHARRRVSPTGTRAPSFSRAPRCKPRLGNAPHRVYETPAGNAQRDRAAESRRRRTWSSAFSPQLDFTETRFIANVSGSTIEEYVEVTRRFDQSPIDAIEINISCPNVKEGGVAFGNYPDMSAQVVAACRRVTRKPLITKLSPNQTDIKENARRCIEAGTDAFAVINTVMGMAIDVRSRRPVIGNVQGGLSGPAIKPIALLKVHQVYEVARPHGVPIIGQGGITTATDALEFMIAGATAVGVGTALFYDPMVCKKINAGDRRVPARAGPHERDAAGRLAAHRKGSRGLLRLRLTLSVPAFPWADAPITFPTALVCEVGAGFSMYNIVRVGAANFTDIARSFARIARLIFCWMSA